MEGDQPHCDYNSLINGSGPVINVPFGLPKLRVNPNRTTLILESAARLVKGEFLIVAL